MKREDVAKALDELLVEITDITKESNDEEIRVWLMASTLRIWSGNKMFSEEYIGALEAIDKKRYSTAQVITALECAGEQGREIKIPDFYKSIVKKDLEKGKSDSRNIADSIGRFLVIPALINGDFTMDEAVKLREISDHLLEYCDFQGVVEGKTRESHPDMITPLNKNSYYQPKSETKDLKKENSDKGLLDKYVESKVNVMSKEEDKLVPITLNFNFSSSQVAEDKETDVKNDEIAVKKPEIMDENSKETLESVLAELNKLVGLDKVKNDVQSLINFIKVSQMRIKRGMKVPTISYHLVFTGNPGTGKTTVARLVARLYYLMGILPQGQLVETDRSGLVAGYLGQTAIKTQKVIQEALGGVLFIDEAYSLANDKDDSYGKEAIETLLKAMEDHRDELVVIVAGYDELMHKFIESNPGLKSRFNKYFHFPDYNGEELFSILKCFCDANGYTLSEDSVPCLKEKLCNSFETRDEHFGNARAIRNLFEHAINYQANRLVGDDDISDRELAELTLDDILPALEVM